MAEVKIDTFNFTRYDLLQGKGSACRKTPSSGRSPARGPAAKPGGALSDTSEPAGQELLYSARIALDGTQMQIEDKLVNLTPGMAVTVEIKTGKRRLIELPDVAAVAVPA